MLEPGRSGDVRTMSAVDAVKADEAQQTLTETEQAILPASLRSQSADGERE